LPGNPGKIQRFFLNGSQQPLDKTDLGAEIENLVAKVNKILGNWNQLIFDFGDEMLVGNGKPATPKTKMKNIVDEGDLRRIFGETPTSDLLDVDKYNEGENIGGIIDEAFSRASALEVGKIVPEALTFMRQTKEYSRCTNSVLFLNKLPKLLSEANNEKLNKYIGKNFRGDIMKGDFLEAFYAIKGWLGLTDMGARDVYHGILAQTLGIEVDNLQKECEENGNPLKAYMIVKGPIKNYFDRIESSLVGQQLSPGIYHTLNLYGIRDKDTVKREVLRIFKLLDIRDCSPSNPTILALKNHATRHRVEYVEMAPVESHNLKYQKLRPHRLKERDAKIIDKARTIANLIRGK
jgi:hypothetical protein